MNKIFKNMKHQIKTAAFLTLVSVLFFVLIPINFIKAADWYDSGWIYASDSRFHADKLFTDCTNVGSIAILTSNYNGEAWHAWVDINAPQGNYRVDLKLGFTHKTCNPPQSDETIRIYSKVGITNTVPPTTFVDSADINDMGDYEIRPDHECEDYANAIKTYNDVAGRELRFDNAGDLFLQGTGSSVRVLGVRIYGYKQETGTPSLVIHKTVDKSNVSPGAEIVYTLNYGNIGNATATGVIVKDTFNYVNQNYLTFISATPSPSSGTDIWNVGTLNVGQSGTITIRARVSNAVPMGTSEIKNRGSIQSNETAFQYSNCANFFVTASGNPSLSITKSVDKYSASPGDEIVYTLNYKNTGQGAATNVVITDPFNNTNQNYLTFISATPSPSSGTDTWNVGTLNAGQSGTITIRARISSSVPAGSTEIKNKATIQSNESVIQYSNYVSIYVNSQVRLSIGKLGKNITEASNWSDFTSAKPSQRVAFSINVSAIGSANAVNVIVSDLLPAKLIYINGSTKIDGVFAADGITSDGINVGTVFAGQSKTITFEANTAEENQFPIGDSDLVNLGLAFSEGTGKISDSAMVRVTRDLPKNPILSITKSVDKYSASPGDEIVYTLNYKNTGQGAATNVVITDPFNNTNQNYLTFISATPSPSSGTDTWNVGTLNAGQSGTITIRARISSSVPTGNVEILNKAGIDCNENVIQYSNYVSTNINTNLGMSIDKLVRSTTSGSSFTNSLSIVPQEEVEFSITVRATGGGSVENVRIWDTLPNRLNYISGSTTVDGVSHADGIVAGGIYIGNLNSQQTKIIKFRARAVEETLFNIGVTILTNYAYASGIGVATIYDSASVEVKKDSGCSPSLQINKQVRDITQGYGYWTDSVFANPGDEIEILIRINSVGNETAENSRAKDQLPTKLNYVSGSTTVDGAFRGDGIISSDGISLGNMAVGSSREIKFKARLASATEFGSSIATLTNYAYAWADRTCGEISDSAQINVNRQQTQNYALSISKLGRNFSRNQVELLDSFLASPSEEVEFSIQVTNIGNIDLNNVRVWDSLPANLSVISGSTTIDGVSWGGDVIGAGLDLGLLRQSQTKTIKFRAKLVSSDRFGAGSNTLINTAYVSASNVSQISDQASVIIYRPGDVLGAGNVKTGANSMSLIFLMFVSCSIAFFIYCHVREDKILEILNTNKGNRFYRALIKFYFRMKLMFKIKTLRFKKVYW